MGNLGRTVGLLLLGLLLGTGLGLFIGWGVWPTEFTDANPAVLHEEYQADYIQLIADIYADDGDLRTALIRLGDFGPDYQAVLLNTINDQLLSQQSSPNELLRLATLANDAGVSSPVIDSLLPSGNAP